MENFNDNAVEVIKALTYTRNSKGQLIPTWIFLNDIITQTGLSAEIIFKAIRSLKYNIFKVTKSTPKFEDTPVDSLIIAPAELPLEEIKSNYEDFFDSTPTIELIFSGDQPSNNKKELQEEMIHKGIDYTGCLKSIINYMISEGITLEPLPKIKLNNKDQSGLLIKTGYYDPKTSTIVLFTKDRHPKDILRTFAHELIHHYQNLQGKQIQTVNSNKIIKSAELEDFESEAYTKGDLYFRKWTELYEDELNKLSNNETTKAPLTETIQGLEVYSEDEILDIVKSHINSLLINEDVFPEEFTIVDLAAYGSRRRHTAKENSDLDIVVEYTGTMREDDAFNLLNRENLQIEGIKIDINPIKAEKSGTMDYFLKKASEYDSNILKEDIDSLSQSFFDTWGISENKFNNKHLLGKVESITTWINQYSRPLHLGLIYDEDTRLYTSKIDSYYYTIYTSFLESDEGKELENESGVGANIDIQFLHHQLFVKELDPLLMEKFTKFMVKVINKINEVVLPKLKEFGFELVSKANFDHSLYKFIDLTKMKTTSNSDGTTHVDFIENNDVLLEQDKTKKLQEDIDDYLAQSFFDIWFISEEDIVAKYVNTDIEAMDTPTKVREFLDFIWHKYDNLRIPKYVDLSWYQNTGSGIYIRNSLDRFNFIHSFLKSKEGKELERALGTKIDDFYLEKQIEFGDPLVTEKLTKFMVKAVNKVNEDILPQYKEVGFRVAHKAEFDDNFNNLFDLSKIRISSNSDNITHLEFVGSEENYDVLLEQDKSEKLQEDTNDLPLPFFDTWFISKEDIRAKGRGMTVFNFPATIWTDKYNEIKKLNSMRINLFTDTYIDDGIYIEPTIIRVSFIYSFLDSDECKELENELDIKIDEDYLREQIKDKLLDPLLVEKFTKFMTKIINQVNEVILPKFKDLGFSLSHKAKFDNSFHGLFDSVLVRATSNSDGTTHLEFVGPEENKDVFLEQDNSKTLSKLVSNNHQTLQEGARNFGLQENFDTWCIYENDILSIYNPYDPEFEMEEEDWYENPHNIEVAYDNLFTDIDYWIDNFCPKGVNMSFKSGYYEGVSISVDLGEDLSEAFLDSPEFKDLPDELKDQIDSDYPEDTDVGTTDPRFIEAWTTFIINLINEVNENILPKLKDLGFELIYNALFDSIRRTAAVDFSLVNISKNGDGTTHLSLDGGDDVLLEDQIDEAKKKSKKRKKTTKRKTCKNNICFYRGYWPFGPLFKVEDEDKPVIPDPIIPDNSDDISGDITGGDSSSDGTTDAGGDAASGGVGVGGSGGE